MIVYYIINFFGKEVSGVQKKILSQVENLNMLGLPSVIYSITGTNDDSPALPFVQKIVVPDLDINSPKSYPGKIRRITTRFNALRKIIETAGEDTVLYTRIPLYSRQMSEILRELRKCKIVVEYQSIGPKESRLNRDLLNLTNDYLYGDDVRGHLDGIVGVTDEITQYELKRSGDPDKPHITIGNGFDFRSVPLRKPPAMDDSLHLLCVANVSKWHGLDRLLKGMANYGGKTPVIFHIAGNGEEILYLRQMVENLNLKNSVQFHGFLTGKDLDNLFDSCHVAVGSLGIHRMGMHEASILKAREYCARGIPFIYGIADPDFPEDFPYILRIPPDESPVDIENVIEFANALSGEPDYNVKMRDYSLEHLDWSVKMRALKGFFEELLGESTV